ncbi:MAG: Gfo/Idh/MocA family protein, partial [Candidatus Baldrarchaeia archaeon]
MRKKTAVIGCGWFGSAHCRVYSSISDLVAVCDADDKKAKKLSEEYRANWYTDPVEMFEKENVDAVSVVVPPEHIPRVTKVAAEYGVDVLM